MIKIIFFDGNGVIYERDKKDSNQLFKELSKKSGFKKTKEAFNLLNINCKNGDYSRIDLFSKLVKIIGLKEDPVKLEKRYFKLKNNSTSIIKDSLQPIKELKSKGLKLGLVSNSNFTGSEREAWLVKNGVKEFDYIFTSSDFKTTKLKPEFPLKAISKSGYRIEEAILVSHKLSDFIGAMLTGMATMSIGKDLQTTYNVKKLQLIPSLLTNKKLI